MARSVRMGTIYVIPNDSSAICCRYDIEYRVIIVIMIIIRVTGLVCIGLNLHPWFIYIRKYNIWLLLFTWLRFNHVNKCIWIKRKVQNHIHRYLSNHTKTTVHINRYTFSKFACTQLYPNSYIEIAGIQPCSLQMREKIPLFVYLSIWMDESSRFFQSNNNNITPTRLLVAGANVNNNNLDTARGPAKKFSRIDS